MPESEPTNQTGDENRYQLLAETMLQGVVHQDASCRLINMNPAAERIIGRTREALVAAIANQGERDAIREDGSPLPRTEHPSQVALRTGQAVHGAVMGIFNTVEQAYRWIRVDAMPIFRPGVPGPVEVYTVLEDITEQRKTESRLKELVALADARAAELAIAKNHAEAANRAKDHFLALLSHELRTPLTPVLATSMILETDRRLAADQLEMIQMIRRNVELEARLIDDLLDITRITRNKLELKISVVDVHRKINDVLDICAEEAANKRHTIQTELDAVDYKIDGDPARLQQIIWNLLKNAIKFTHNAGQIRITTSNPGKGRLKVAVIDNGIGIDAESFPRIFDAFEQGGREVTRRFGGLGLGLAISKALVEMHGGTISAESAGKDRGSTFAVEFPTSSRTLSNPRTIAGKPLNPMNCRILLAEDHADTRRVMTTLLSKLGCEVKAASTVAEALLFAEQQKFDLLISDIGLPDAAGTDLMREVKARYGLRGIALSGYGMDEDLARSREAGFSMHLTKPVNIQELQDAIRKFTESS